MLFNKYDILPIPPLRYFPNPPVEPVWQEQRQHYLVSALHRYINELVQWMELCRCEMSFRRENGLPIASHELCDSFLHKCLTFIKKWISILEQWTDVRESVEN